MFAAVESVFLNFANFSDRASRREYWFFALFNLLAVIVLVIVDGMLGTPLSAVFSLIVIIPGLAVLVRRLHDTNRSGWWILISFIPLVGAIMLLIWTVSPGTDGGNNYGMRPIL